MKTEPIVVPIIVGGADLEHRLSVLRQLCSQIGFALDTALLGLAEGPPHAEAEEWQP